MGACATKLDTMMTDAVSKKPVPASGADKTTKDATNQ